MPTGLRQGNTTILSAVSRRTSSTRLYQVFERPEAAVTYSVSSVKLCGRHFSSSAFARCQNSTAKFNNMPDSAPLVRFREHNKKWAASLDPELLKENARGQKPVALWIGCSDSRVPEALVCGTKPGDIFVHRNIANSFKPDDPSALAVLTYALNNLQIKNVVVSGHYGCGGVSAALQMAKSKEPLSDDPEFKNIGNWLSPLVELASEQLSGPVKYSSVEEEEKALVRIHVMAQVQNVENTTVVKKIRAANQELHIRGWIYDVVTGLVSDAEPEQE